MKKSVFLRGLIQSITLIFVVNLMMISQMCANDETPVKLSFKDLQGKKVHISDYHGQVIVLNFWATWCPPCRDELPLLVKAQDAYASKGVVIIGASLDEKRAWKKIPSFVKKHHLNFPIWLNASADDLAKLDLGVAIPATVFIDQEGKIVGRILGQMREHEIQERLNWLLGDQTEPPPKAWVSHLDVAH